MMKHGALILVLACTLTAAVTASEVTGGDWEVLSPAELEAIDGGDLLLSVDRDKQMMTVTRITPGNYDNIQSYSLKVTTAVVRNFEVSPSLAKGAMVNSTREVQSGSITVRASQFPTGVATVSPVLGTSPLVKGPVIYTNASQMVTVVSPGAGKPAAIPDYGYNIHYVDPAKGTNTLGCIGVQSLAGMNKLAASLRADNATATATRTPVQSVSVSAYSGALPPASTFYAKEKAPTKTSSKR